MVQYPWKRDDLMKKTYFFAAAAILMWSTMSTVSKLLLGEMDTYTVLCVSSLLATLAMLVIVLASGKLRIMRGYKLSDYLKMSAIGLPGVFLYYSFYYAGATRLPASQAFITNYLWPIMSIVFAVILLREKMTLPKAVAVLMSFAGVFTVAGNDILSFSTDSILGTVFCIAGAVCYGLFTVLNKKSPYDKQISMMMAMFASFVLSLAVVLFCGGSFAIEPAKLPGIVWNGVFTMALANLSWTLALSGANTAKVSNLAYITPFLSLVWTYFVLDEIPSPMSVVGLCLIVCGIFIQLRGDGKRRNIKENSQ